METNTKANTKEANFMEKENMPGPMVLLIKVNFMKGQDMAKEVGSLLNKMEISI